MWRQVSIYAKFRWLWKGVELRKFRKLLQWNPLLLSHPSISHHLQSSNAIAVRHKITNTSLVIGIFYLFYQQFARWRSDLRLGANKFVNSFFHLLLNKEKRWRWWWYCCCCCGWLLKRHLLHVIFVYAEMETVCDASLASVAVCIWRSLLK